MAAIYEYGVCPVVYGLCEIAKNSLTKVAKLSTNKIHVSVRCNYILCYISAFPGMPALLFHSTRPEKKVTREKFNFSDDGELNHRLLHEIVARNNQSSGLRAQTDFWSSFLSTRK